MTSDTPSNGDHWECMVWEKHRYNDRTVIKSGSYLRASCPYCAECLIAEGMIRLASVSRDGRKGWVELSPYLNVFERRSDIHLSETADFSDLVCPHCHRSLRVPERKCGRGDASVAVVMVGISTINVPFYFCMQTGCTWHLIDPEDEHRIILDDSLEW